MWVQLLAKIMESVHLDNVHHVFFYLAVNELTDKLQNIFCSVAEQSVFIKYILNNLEKVI